MPCYRPLPAFHNKATGAVYFHEKKRHGDCRQIALPCGQCIGCRLERSRQWAARCLHHASLHKHNAFVTLTYNPERLVSPSLRHRHFQLFMKRLREKLSRSSDQMLTDLDLITLKPKISYYMAGEYGTQNRRPHFHTCLFGVDFKDKKYRNKTPAGSKIYTSATLDTLWDNQGYTSIGDVNFESAAYIARYIMTRQTGPGAWKYYEHIDEQTGEITDLKPEYNKMSLRPAIAKQWIEKYTADVYPEGKLTIRNKKMNTTKYYDKQYKKKDKANYEEMKTQRELQQTAYMADNSYARLKVKEHVKRAQINQLLRRI